MAGLIPLCLIVLKVPLLVAISTYLIWDTVGESAFAGLGVLLVILPLNSWYLAAKIGLLQVQMHHSLELK